MNARPAASAPVCAAPGGGFSLPRFPPGSTDSDPGPGEAWHLRLVGSRGVFSVHRIKCQRNEPGSVYTHTHS